MTTNYYTVSVKPCLIQISGQFHQTVYCPQQILYGALSKLSTVLGGMPESRLLALKRSSALRSSEVAPVESVKLFASISIRSNLSNSPGGHCFYGNNAARRLVQVPPGVRQIGLGAQWGQVRDVRGRIKCDRGGRIYTRSENHLLQPAPMS